jgi:alkanesulfonate monooxygenase SsuD/methylene tetrahydromethanopterin reductase-like flavin-dependent oxidoreductase (luciferase family)
MADVDAGGNRVTGTGVVLRDPLRWPDERQLVETAESMGYGAVFVPEIAAREAFSTLTGFAAATSTMRLGTGVVTMWSRSPTITAMAAATVQDVSYGRLILGLGAGSMPPGAAGGERPLERLRTYVGTVRTALSGRPVPPDDAFGAGGFVLAPELTDGPPPIWLAALGDRSLRLAGELADGVVLNWCTPERVRAARALLTRAAQGAGRDPGAITVSVYVRACLGVRADVALAALREPAGQYASIPHYLRQFERMGLGDEARAAAAAFEGERIDDVPESFLRALTVMGGRREAKERERAYRDAGADLVLWYPVPALDPISSIMGTIMAAAPDPTVVS